MLQGKTFTSLSTIYIFSSINLVMFCFSSITNFCELRWTSTRLQT